MIALTIAKGQRYLAMAARAAESVRRHTGLDVQIVTEIPVGQHPSFYRLWLWEFVPPDVDEVLWFDADTYTVRDWWPWEYAKQAAFVGRPDLPSRGLLDECARWGLVIQRYLNAGVFVATRRSRPAFELAQQIVSDPKYSSVFCEQTALNVGLRDAGTDVGFWHPRYNAICRPASVPVDPVVLHRAGGGRNRRNAEIFDRLIAEREGRRACLLP